MRVLTTGRVALVLVVSPVLAAGAVVLALPASAGVPAPAGAPGGVQVGRTVATAGHAPAASAAVPTAGVVLGPAVKYVRDADGTVRRVR